MIGENISTKNDHQNITNSKKVILEINNFTYSNIFKQIDIKLLEGEILGISGLLGSGANELLRSIFGIIKQDEGQISLNNKNITINKPKDAVAYGIGYIPSDRKNEGLIQDNSIKDNSVLTIFDKLTKIGFFKFSEASNTTKNYIKKLDIKASNIDNFVMNLSGGNQQKVVIAKWLAKKCKILLFDEPTRGIDVAAKAQIWKLITEFTKEGGSVIVASNEIPELINNCSRIITMQKGFISNTFNYENFNEQKISLNISSK
tara:strand:- start:214 stop:993 length:780 start_codon:yes stop_codon:yes gene_type:complete